MAGNAKLTLISGDYEIWVQSISTATNNQFMTQQTHNEISWVPIRRAEMFIEFTVAWPLTAPVQPGSKPDIGFEDISLTDGFAKMNKLQDKIREHQLSISRGGAIDKAGNIIPMVLNYYNNSSSDSPIFNTLISQNPIPSSLFPKVHGIIRNVEKKYERFRNVFVTTYNMNIITPNIAKTPNSYMDPNYNFAYAPTVATQRNYGYGWASASTIKSMAAKSKKIRGIPKGNS